MNKNAIQKYAIWARSELIEQVKQRAYQYGITDKGYGDENAAVIAGRVLSDVEREQRKGFVAQIKEHGFQQAVEEVAYTWFNRFVALRYMEVNDYLPTHVRVFSDANGGFNPEILRDVLHLDLPGLDRAKVSELLNANKTEELYRYLLLTQCNALNEALPEMFEKLGSYTEMLLPNNILGQESVLARLVKDIPEEDWRDAVQIIGWLYQYYNTEPKQAVFDGLKKNVKITKENIPAATQLFTPDWIVRYMVENSLGRLWINHLESSFGYTYEINVPLRNKSGERVVDVLKSQWNYYLDEAQQTEEVEYQTEKILETYRDLKPEDIKVIDPCMGSGHILVYAFDVLMQIYRSAGYADRDAAKLILENNLFGLDIDRRAYQLAYFSLMMKARQYSHRIFTKNIKPQVYHPTGWSDGEEYGSLLKIDALGKIPQEPQTPTLFDNYERDLRVWNFKRLLSQKYDVVVTNPPYMGASGMNGKLSEFVKREYPGSKSDASTAFMEQTLYLCKSSGYMAMINIPVWMFLSSYEKLRKNVLTQNTIINMLHFGRGIFGSDFGSTSFVIGKTHKKGYIGSYRRLFKKHGAVDSVEQKERWFFEGMGVFTADSSNFAKITGSPVAYWVRNFAIFDFEELGNGYKSGGRNKTHENEKYVRCWWEIADRVRFAPYANGGEYRKWYGNHIDLVDWSDKAKAEYDSHGGLYNKVFWGKQGICWNLITSALNGFRVKYPEFHYSSASPTLISENDEQDYLRLGFLNTKLAAYLLKVFNPTLNTTVTDVMSLPFNCGNAKDVILSEVESNISLSRADWDAFETSWNFKRHPLVYGVYSRQKALEGTFGDYMVEGAFQEWQREATERFNTLKANEKELNRIFIDIYCLQDELSPEVEDKDVTVRRADLGREIRSLISYAVGCMFGRYSLDVEGLAYAGDDWDADKYKSFLPDKDNILPICDDEYFDDDIVGRFVDFVRVAYGAEWLENNLHFIAEALYPNGNGTPREKIRRYFLNDFYADHCRIYQKRPIYWLFDSGKKNGFKALTYLHRYSRDLLAKLRTDYVHEQQERYRTQLAHVVESINHATGAERARLLKLQDKLTEQAREIGSYEERIHHLADQNIEIDLDDGVKKNYEVFADVLAKL